MPIYEYRCSKCDMVYEELVGMGTDGSLVCPGCGQSGRTRIPSRFAIALDPDPKDGGAAGGSCCGGGSASCGCR